LRGLALAGIASLGLMSIVGSGGGALGFPPCEGIYCGGGSPPPPLPSARVQPPYVTALVGTPVTFTAEASDFTGTLSYQWRRSSDGGSTFVEITGATGKSHLLPSVNLGDDGAVFSVAVRGANGSVTSKVGRLTVSATPGIEFQDGEFVPSNWVASPVVGPGQLPFVHTEEFIATDGNPGGFRKMVVQLPQGAGSARVFHAALSATYEPAKQGAVRVIDYAEDCRAFQSSENTFTESSLVIEQGGRRYLSDTSGSCIAQAWGAVASRSSLGLNDFRLFDGPACNAGESCPDFSSSAAPMRFGYWRISYGMPGDTVAHGIDNWKVTVWRR
jgi:hypothetical protein